jgi:hypothetical protein
MVVMRNHTRMNDQGEPEVWINFDDLLTWLDELPMHANVPAAAGAATEIKNLLIEQFGNALDQYSGD